MRQQDWEGCRDRALKPHPPLLVFPTPNLPISPRKSQLGLFLSNLPLSHPQWDALPFPQYLFQLGKPKKKKKSLQKCTASMTLQ